MHDNSDPVSVLRNQKACGARTRSGNRCRQATLRGKTRCRYHGGRSTGPKTAEGRRRIAEANTRSGNYTKAAKQRRDVLKRTQLMLKAAEQQAQCIEAFKPFMRAFAKAQTREEFGFLGFVVFGGMRRMLQEHGPIIRIFIGEEWFNTFEQFTGKIDEQLRERMDIPKQVWRKLTPQQKSFEWGTLRSVEAQALMQELRGEIVGYLLCGPASLKAS
jgi:hypothetical protein